jgi:zinc protease
LHLAGGLTVLVVHDPQAEGVTLDFASRGAGESGDARTSGLASLAGLLLSDADNSEHPASIAEERGLQFHPRISRDGGDFLLSTTAAKLDDALRQLASALLHPRCRAQTLERLRAEYTNFLIRRTVNSPEQSGVNLVRHRLYGDEHPLGQPPEGVRAVIDTATLEDMQRFCESRIRLKDSALVVVGDTTPEMVRPLVEKAFVEWRSNVAASAAVPPPAAIAPTPTGDPVEVLPWFGATQSWIILGTPGPSRTSPDYASLLVLANLLEQRFDPDTRTPGEGRAKELPTRAWIESSGFGTTLFLIMPVSPGKEGAATRALLQEFDALATRPTTAEDLAIARSRFESSVANAYATPTDAAVTLGALFDARLPFTTETSLVARVETLTSDELQHAAQTIFRPEASRLVVVGEPKRALPSLRAAGFSLPGIAPPPPGRTE